MRKQELLTRVSDWRDDWPEPREQDCRGCGEPTTATCEAIIGGTVRVQVPICFGCWQSIPAAAPSASDGGGRCDSCDGKGFLDTGGGPEPEPHSTHDCYTCLGSGRRLTADEQRVLDAIVDGEVERWQDAIPVRGEDDPVLKAIEAGDADEVGRLLAERAAPASDGEGLREVRILGDSDLWGLLNGRESQRQQRVYHLLKKLRAATKGVSTHNDVTLVVKIAPHPGAAVRELPAGETGARPGDVPRRYEVVAHRPEGSYTYSRSDDLAAAFRDAEDVRGEVYDTHERTYVSPDDAQPAGESAEPGEGFTGERVSELDYPSAWRMVHDLDTIQMHGRQFFYFEDEPATHAAVEAYRKSHLEKGFALDVYAEQRLERFWARIPTPGEGARS